MFKVILIALVVLLLAATIALAANDWCFSVSFRGPGYDEESGVTAPGARERVVVAITHGRVASDRGSGFRDQLKKVLASMPAQSGLIGYQVRKQVFGDKIWTLSAWVDKLSLERFVASSVHAEAMASGTTASDFFHYAEVELPARELPISWDRATEFLRAHAYPEMQ